MQLPETNQIISIKDERLDIGKISQYRLSFFLSPQYCQITVFDDRKKQLLLFESLELKSDKSIIENLELIYNDHILIAAGFWKEVQVFIRNKQFALIPIPVFDRALSPQYVALNDQVSLEKDEFHYKMIDTLGVAVSFGYEKEIRSWFREKYPKLSLYFNHQSIAFLKGISKQLKTKVPSCLFVSLNINEVQIAGFNLERLAIYNQFKFSDAQQLIKLLLLSIQQFSEEGQHTLIILHGVKEKVDLNLPILKKYFKNIELGSRPDGLTMHPIFNELEKHEYIEVMANL